MGDHFTKLEIPKGKPADEPAETEITIEGEVLSEIAYLVPSGCCALASWALFYGIKQIYPETEGDWISGDDLYREVALKWPMPESTVTLTVKGYNLDSENKHTIYLWLFTAKEEEARPWRVISDFVAILKRLIGV